MSCAVSAVFVYKSCLKMAAPLSNCIFVEELVITS